MFLFCPPEVEILATPQLGPSPKMLTDMFHCIYLLSTHSPDPFFVLYSPNIPFYIIHYQCPTISHSEWLHFDKISPFGNLCQFEFCQENLPMIHDYILTIWSSFHFFFYFLLSDPIVFQSWGIVFQSWGIRFCDNFHSITNKTRRHNYVLHIDLVTCETNYWSLLTTVLPLATLSIHYTRNTNKWKVAVALFCTFSYLTT